jgi:hypothetical protein
LLPFFLVASGIEDYVAVMAKVAAYSCKTVLAKLDGRTKEMRLMRQVRADLTAHCGGAPSATQRALIERCAWLSLRVAQFDAKGHLTEHDSRVYLSFSNSLARALQMLGVGSATAEPAAPATWRS